MNIDIDWTRMGEAATFAAISASAAMAVIRARLGRDFATRDALAHLEDRLDAVETTLRAVPTQADLRLLLDRVQKVETGIGVVQASQDGIADGIKRLEHMVDLLLQHQLSKSGDGA